MRSFFTLVFVLASLTLAILASADATRNASPTLPNVTCALPDTLPIVPIAFDWHASDMTAATTTVSRKAHTTRDYPAPSAAIKAHVWTCGAPRNLASDELGTVRVCEFL